MKVMYWIAVAGGAWFALHAAWISWDGFSDERARADVAVVFGSTVNPDGQPSTRLRARLDAAIALYREGRVGKVLVSGGFGQEGFEEADVMAAYAIDAGIPEEDVVVDRTGYDTWRTALAAAAWMRHEDLHSAIAVTEFFHVTRAKLALRRAGVADVRGVHARKYQLRAAYSLGREVLAWYWYELRPAAPPAREVPVPAHLAKS